MTVKELCTELIKEGICSGRTPITKTRPDLCVNISKCPILDKEIKSRWNKKRK